mmetsp:Transcript_80992/g.203860  ORF Transcript_80992/g.203860 Transcript_80992/m.203860 type:complete len:80 (-) Transcript_80992:698-937(-)
MNASVIGATATMRGGMRQLRNNNAAKAIVIAHNNWKGRSWANFDKPVGVEMLSPLTERTAKEPAKMAHPIEPRKPATTG